MISKTCNAIGDSRAAFVSPSHSQRSSSVRLSSSSLLSALNVDGDQGTNDHETNKPEPVQHQHQQHLVLVGGGHAHVQVIKALNHRARPQHLKVTLVDAQKSASYSGMVPGAISGMYTPDETLIHLQPLAEWAGLDFVHDRVVDIDFERKLLYLRNDFENPLAFDAVSIDIGSTSRGIDETPGARQFTIPTRPIDKLVQRLDRAREELQQDMADEEEQPPQPHVVVIGGGAAGVELSMSIQSRWERDGLFGQQGNDGQQPTVTLLDSGNVLLPQESDVARDKLKEIMQSKNIHIRHGCVVGEVCENEIILSQPAGVRIPFTHCVWATGAGAHPLAYHLGRKGAPTGRLATTERGWIRVGPTLQSKSHPFVFAAGDCAAIEDLDNGASSPAKAGVFAVRSGPILIENLTKFLDGKFDELISYQPQDDFLKLLACGDGTALGLRFGLPLYGKWVWEMKNHIDVNFMNLFHVDPATQPEATYNTAQYDDKDAKMMAACNVADQLDISEAAALIQRQDDNVDYLQAWCVLRAMTTNLEYRNAILSCINEQKNNPATATTTVRDEFLTYNRTWHR